jgi:hypothetical protein
LAVRIATPACSLGERLEIAMRFLALLSFLLFASPALGCLVFCFSDGKHVFGGNNEDYLVPDTRMWFVPAEAGSHGRVYFGFANGFPQGGMNDAGLFFDGLALDRREIAKSAERPPFAGNLADRAMAECATVAEVIALFEKHERTMLAAAQLFFGDRTGDAAIVEGTAVIRKHGPFLVATNFRQSQTPPAAISCERYRIATRMLGEAGDASVDVCRRVLAATHQEQPAATLYSNVYDLEEGIVYLYHFHNYENVVQIDLEEELAKGAHTVELKSLFPPTYAFDAFARAAADATAEARRKARDPHADPSKFGDFVGRFRVSEGDAAGLEFEVVLAGNDLMVEFPNQSRYELIPRGGDSFVAIEATLRAQFDFVRGKDGGVTGATLRQDDFEARVSRAR